MICFNLKNKMKNWEKRNIIEKERVNELVELYRDIGFEVMVKDFNPDDFDGECSECMKIHPEKYKIIYTKKLKR
ncbi:hypothetical protein DRQ09_06930 [candidate division KSB1 bacterium]|nr:MAG: hypothetical protein DRQ09_06930 [candidate division KSB1 bacterium]